MLERQKLQHKRVRERERKRVRAGVKQLAKTSSLQAIEKKMGPDLHVQFNYVDVISYN